MIRRKYFLKVFVCLLICQLARDAWGQSRNVAGDNAREPSKTSTAAKPPAENLAVEADDVAARARSKQPVLPGLLRGSDGLLSLEGRRATQNRLVTSSNVKDPVADAFPFTGPLPLEATEAVIVPRDQFSITLPKYYVTVPAVPQISSTDWHYSFGVPFFSVGSDSARRREIRSASPTLSFTGPLKDRRLAIFQSFSYRLSRNAVESVEGDHNDTLFQSYDSNSHVNFKVGKSHSLSAQLALFSQDIDFATLTALARPESTPDYLMRGGQLFLADSFTTTGGSIVDSTINIRSLRLRVLPRGLEPMILVEQGEVFGNYFDTLRRRAQRLEWRESLRFRPVTLAGSHQVRIGGGLTHSTFDSIHLGNEIRLTGDEEDELTSITKFTGNPFESYSVREVSTWGEDSWSPSPWATLTMGLRYDRTSLSRKNQWGPRFGIALLPFANDRTVIRAGAGRYYDVMPMTVGSFPASRQRVIEFFEHGTHIAGPRTLNNVTAKPRLTTASRTAWNVEIDQQVNSRMHFRVKAEEQRGRNLLLIGPDLPFGETTALVIDDNGSSSYRELETTAFIRANGSSTLNVSFIRSSSSTDLNGFGTVMGTFEKLFIASNRYARSRTDAPNRFIGWGTIEIPGKFTLMPAVDVHSGFPFAFTDADNQIASDAEFGRFPRTATVDLGLNRDFNLRTFDRQGNLRLGLRIYNLLNHFNPRDVEVTEDEHESEGRISRFLNGARRTYRVTLVYSF